MTTLAQALDQVHALQVNLAAVRAQLEWLKKKFSCGDQGERLDRAQLSLPLEQLDKLAAASAAKTTAATHERTAPQSRVTPAEEFAHLPVTETVEIVPEAVKAEPDLYEKIGEEEAFEVDVVPPQLVKRRIVRLKYRHQLDRTRPSIVAPEPAQPVSGGYASAGMLA